MSRTRRAVVNALIKRYGKKHEADIRRGVVACARVWSFDEWGEDAFAAFCGEQYAPPGKARRLLLRRLDEFHHSVTGSAGMAVKTVRAGIDIADRPDLPAESVLGAFAPGAHLSEDYRNARISALAQLNFGSDETRPPRTREAWAARRLAKLGRVTVPAKLTAEMSRVAADVDRFVSSYNLHLDRIDFGDPKVRFPKGTRLISHWGLRDYMTSLNGTPHALRKQRAIADLMRRVVDGAVPAEVLDDPSVRWSVGEGTIANGAGTRRARGHGPLRWEKFRRMWKLQRKLDAYRIHGNLIDEKFLEDREIEESVVVGILTDVLSSPLARRVSRYVSDRLGRPLEPFDVYYTGFTAGASKPPLAYDIKARYPSVAALQSAIPDVLTHLGWTRERAEWIGSRIRVDNSRSAGHAWPPSLDEDVQLLRVRVDPDGCNERDFDTFMHELGHCVEGVLSSYEMDYKMLWSVPNTAVTEGFAFTLEDRADDVLGRDNPDGDGVHDATELVRFWEPFEIAGPALTEIRFFHWLYAHPTATATAIQKAIRRIGDEVWEEFYAPIFGPEGYGFMSVYSHVLFCDFYLADYPMGYVIAYQIRKHLRDRPLADEMERICGIGSIYPDEWMKKAVGRKISVKPLLDGTRGALERLGY